MAGGGGDQRGTGRGQSTGHPEPTRSQKLDVESSSLPTQTARLREEPNVLLTEWRLGYLLDRFCKHESESDSGADDLKTNRNFVDVRF